MYVLKFGGTSLADLTCIEHAASLIYKRKLKNERLAVVVSAMAGTTNELLQNAKTFCPNQYTPEHSVVATAGEQITSGLMALALKKFGLRSRSYLAWQLPIRCDSSSRITHITTHDLEENLNQDIVPVVAGFQGITADGLLTTLGRGGSDATAVALAFSLKAKRCDIYTDVEGVYTADPRIVSKAKKLPILTYQEMLEMSSQGALVLQTRSVELAMKNKVPLLVLSSFVEAQGTMIMENRQTPPSFAVSSIAHSYNEARITLSGVPNAIGTGVHIFTPLAQQQIAIDMISQSYTKEGSADLSFAISQIELEKALSILEKTQTALPYQSLKVDQNMGKVSVIGIGMQRNPYIASQVFQKLAQENISIHILSNSEIRISVLIQNEHVDKAVRVLHDAFQLDRSC